MAGTFPERLAAAVQRVGAPVCVGIDPHLDRLPAPLRLPPSAPRDARADAVRTFCFGAVDALAGRVTVVKPQSAFFEALGAPGVAALEDVVRRAREAGLIVLLDAKRGDIGSTAAAYAQATLDPDGPLAADAVTLSPYLGPESMRPFLDLCDSGGGVFALVRTSNPGAGAWQEGLADRVADFVEAESARRVDSSGFGPVGAVVAANLGPEIARFRARMPHAWLLMPGLGAQGATPDDVRPHLRPDGLGALVTASRSVLFPNTPERDWRQGIADRAARLVRALRPERGNPGPI